MRAFKSARNMPVLMPSELVARRRMAAQALTAGESPKCPAPADVGTRIWMHLDAPSISMVPRFGCSLDLNVPSF